MLACRALRMVGDPPLSTSAYCGAEASVQQVERALADRARERLRDAEGLREPIEPKLRRCVETLLQRRRSRERMRRDYQLARRLLAADRWGDSPVVLALSDGAACRAAQAWAAAVILSCEARAE